MTPQIYPTFEKWGRALSVMVVESIQEMENISLLIALLPSCDFVAKFWKKVVSKIVGVPHLRN